VETAFGMYFEQEAEMRHLWEEVKEKKNREAK
jgi:hypothetical protein